MCQYYSQVLSHTQRSSAAGSRRVTAMGGKGKFFVGGNWKCNETVAEVQQLVEELNAGTVPSDIEVVVAPTYIHLALVRTACEDIRLPAGSYRRQGTP